MSNKILFIGSIGVLAETSELQRQAYNQALEENGVNWEWNPETYQELLQNSGGLTRLTLLSKATGSNLSEEQIQKIHARKTEIACQLVKDQKVAPRAGIVDFIKKAKEQDIKVAWVTTTSEDNTKAILEAFDGAISADDFDHIFYKKDVDRGKPFPDIYQAALKHYQCDAGDCIAVEDSINSILAAKGAGIFTVATLGNYHKEHVDNISDVVLDSLEQTSWEELAQQAQLN